MSTDVSILLKMLEPAVRPGGLGSATGASPAKTPDAPFEAQPFEQLLRSAKTESARTPPAEQAEAAKPAVPSATALAPLSDLGRVENADVRRLLSQPPIQTKTL